MKNYSIEIRLLFEVQAETQEKAFEKAEERCSSTFAGEDEPEHMSVEIINEENIPSAGV